MKILYKNNQVHWYTNPWDPWIYHWGSTNPWIFTASLVGHIGFYTRGTFMSKTLLSGSAASSDSTMVSSLATFPSSIKCRHATWAIWWSSKDPKMGEIHGLVPFPAGCFKASIIKNKLIGFLHFLWVLCFRSVGCIEAKCFENLMDVVSWELEVFGGRPWFLFTGTGWIVPLSCCDDTLRLIVYTSLPQSTHYSISWGPEFGELFCEERSLF